MAFLNKPSQSCGMSLVMWDHTVLPATRHKWTHPAVTPANGRYSINILRMDWRLSWPTWPRWLCLHSQMVYPSTDDHPSKY